MEIGNFQDITFIIFFVSMIVGGLTILLTTAFFVTQTLKERSYENQLSHESSSTVIYIINARQNRVTYFNKSDMKHKITADLNSFYNIFHPNDVEKVKSWVFSICVDPKKADEYLEADVLTNNSKKPFFSLLRLLKYNPEVGLVHIESRILKYITPNNAPKTKSSKRKVPTGIVKRSVIQSLVNKNKSLRGYSYCIRFFYAKQKTLSNNKIERHMIMTFKNVVYPYGSLARTQRQILDEGGDELFLFDLKISNRDSALQLANSIAHALRKSMEVNGFAGYMSFVIGVVENGQYYQDFDSIIECCKEACISGQTNGQEVVVHQRNINVNSDMVQYQEQIEHIMKDDVLRYLFRPIIDAKKSEVIGYFEYVRAYDSPFSNFQEMSKYAAKINQNVNLFATIAKHVIPKFASECNNPNSQLFLSVSMVDIENIVDIINQIPASLKIDIVYVFDEQEVNENASSIELLKEALNNFIDQGFKIALLLKDKDLLLDDSVYFLFDYFIVGSTMLSAIRKNNRIRLSTYTLIESLLKYNKKIIATDLESWQAVELIIESGITYISSEVIAPSNDMLLPLEKKKIEKVASMADKYLY